MKVQIYLELFQSLLAKFTETYAHELEKNPLMSQLTKQKALGFIIEISNNI